MMNHRNEPELNGLWGDGVLRAFISHVAEHKDLATEIKFSLEQYGIASFVAHEDIEPMKEWELEIESALFSMNILVALLTEGFSESKWTDQEVGVAVGRGVPIVPVRLGKDPYGFMARYQAIPGSRTTAEIVHTIFLYVLRHEGLKEIGTDAYIAALANSGNFHRSNTLARFLPDIEHLSPGQEEALVEAFDNNGQVNGAYEIRDSIVGHLKRITGNDYGIVNYRLVPTQLINIELPF